MSVKVVKRYFYHSFKSCTCWYILLARRFQYYYLGINSFRVSPRGETRPALRLPAACICRRVKPSFTCAFLSKAFLSPHNKNRHHNEYMSSYNQGTCTSIHLFIRHSYYINLKYSTLVYINKNVTLFPV